MGIQYEKQRAKDTSLCYTRNNISIIIKLTIINNPLQSIWKKNSVRILRKGSPTPNCLSLNMRALWFTWSKAALKSRPTMSTSQPQSNTFWTKLVMVRRASQVPRHLQKSNCRCGKRFFFSAKLFRHFANKCSKTLDKTEVMVIGR